MRDPAFTSNLIVVTERLESGEFVTRVLEPPRKGWRQRGLTMRFDGRAASLLYAAKLAVDLDAGIMTDHPTTIANPVDGWPFNAGADR